MLAALSTLVDGFAVSSLFEARLAREFTADGGTVHFTSPGVRPDEYAELARLCDCVACNSVHQFDLFKAHIDHGARMGVRINPQLSLVDDARYDPCRRHSKLGVPLDHAEQLLASGAFPLERLSGLHFHSNSEAPSLIPLLRTVEHVADRLGGLLEQVDWINLGGGYLFDDRDDQAVLARVAALLHDRFGLEVFLEPGTAIAADCCTLVTRVLDIFPSQGKSVAVLDTSVNHCPEVFEYGYRPDVAGDTDDGAHAYILAGSSCLAGDVFGEYRFREPLAVGTMLNILYCGAYALVKAHMFNGINLPSLYARAEPGATPRLTCSFSYADYRSRFG